MVKGSKTFDAQWEVDPGTGPTEELTKGPVMYDGTDYGLHNGTWGTDEVDEGHVEYEYIVLAMKQLPPEDGIDKRAVSDEWGQGD